MSIAVGIAELVEEIESWGAAAVITVGEHSARVVTLFPSVVHRDGEADASTAILRFAGAGRSARQNVERNQAVTLYFAPHSVSEGYSLIVDGTGTWHDEADALDVAPTSAVRHRPPPL